MSVRTFFGILSVALCVVSTAYGSFAGEQGYDCYFKNDLRGALAAYRTSLKDARHSADNVREVICLNNLATVFFGLKELDSATAYIELAKTASQASPPLTALVGINEQLLRAPAITTDIPIGAVEELQKQLSTYEYASVLIGLGRVKLVHDDPKAALSLFKKAYKKLKKGKNPLGMANAAYFTARALKAMEKTEEALRQVVEAEQLYREKEHVYGIKKCLVLEEILYRSLSFFKQADDIRRRINNLQ